MQELEELLKKPEIYENLSLFKEFLKGIKKLCDQFEEKIKMIPKQEYKEEVRIKKKIEKQLLKKKRKKERQQGIVDTTNKQQAEEIINGNQMEKLNFQEGSMVEIQDLNHSPEIQTKQKTKYKKKKAEVKREEEDLKGIQDEDSFGGNIVQDYE